MLHFLEALVDFLQAFAGGPDLQVEALVDFLQAFAEVQAQVDADLQVEALVDILQVFAEVQAQVDAHLQVEALVDILQVFAEVQEQVEEHLELQSDEHFELQVLWVFDVVAVSFVDLHKLVLALNQQEALVDLLLVLSCGPDAQMDLHKLQCWL